MPRQRDPEDNPPATNRLPAQVAAERARRASREVGQLRGADSGPAARTRRSPGGSGRPHHPTRRGGTPSAGSAGFNDGDGDSRRDGLPHRGPCRSWSGACLGRSVREARGPQTLRSRHGCSGRTRRAYDRRPIAPGHRPVRARSQHCRARQDTVRAATNAAGGAAPRRGAPRKNAWRLKSMALALDPWPLRTAPGGVGT